MNCPKCNGDVWDNREKKANGEMKPNAPDLSCKDKESCGWVKWPDKGKAQNKQSSAPRTPKWTWRSLHSAYNKCWLLAESVIVQSSKRTKIGFTTQDIHAATATLFIVASRDGVIDEKPREPVTAAALSERPEQLDDDSDSSLPF